MKAIKISKFSGHTQRPCDHCGKAYQADNRNLKRGWGLCCSKRCAAKKRERSRPGYDPKTVAYNNLKREGLLDNGHSHPENYDPGDSEYWDSKDYGP